MEYPKPKPRKKKKHTIQQVSKSQAQLNRDYRKAIEEIGEERPPYCESCGKYEFDHSHIIPRSRSREHYANKENILRQCRHCHLNWESGFLWLLDNGEEIMDWLKETDEEYYYVKLYQMQDRAIEEDVYEELPTWCKKLD